MTVWSRRAVMTAGAAMFAAGCTGPSGPIITGETAIGVSADAAAFAGILARRAAAVRSGDEAAFLADLDIAKPGLRSQQRMLFANYRQLTFASFGYVPVRHPVRLPDGRVAFDVVGILQLSIDDAGAGVLPGETWRYTVSAKDSRLIVTDIVGKTHGSTGMQGVEGPFADAPWNSTALTVKKAGNVWLAADTSVTDLDRYVALATGEAHRIDALWGGRLRYPGSMLFFTRDPQAFKTWYGFGSAPHYRDTVEGIATARLGVRANGALFSGQFAGSRVVVNLMRTDAAKDDPQHVIRHELAHAVTARAREVGAGFDDFYCGAPVWAVEGFAAWTETLDSPHRAAAYRHHARTGFTGSLPRSDSFYSGDTGAHYAQAATVFLLAQQLKGPRRRRSSTLRWQVTPMPARNRLRHCPPLATFARTCSVLAAPCSCPSGRPSSETEDDMFTSAIKQVGLCVAAMLIATAASFYLSGGGRAARYGPVRWLSPRRFTASPA